MESTEASWVSMIMDRLHALEQENDELKRELDKRCPPVVLKSSTNTAIRDMTDVQSTYFEVAVYTDRPGLCHLMDFGKALLEVNDLPFGEITLRSLSWSIKKQEEASLRRNIMYITGLVQRSAVEEVIRMFEKAWGESLTPTSLPETEVYTNGRPAPHFVSFANIMKQTVFYDVWTCLLGWGATGLVINLDERDISSDEECIWGDLVHQDPSAGHARLLTAYGTDQIRLYGEADELLQRFLSDPDVVIDLH